MQAQSVTRDIRTHPFTAVKGFEQMPLIDGIDAWAMIDDAQLDFSGAGLALHDNFDLSLVTGFAIFECIAQKVLETLGQSRRICFHGRKVLVDVRRKLAVL